MRMETSEAIRLFGSKAEIARALGISRAAVTCWGAVVPPLRVYQLREILQAQKSEKPIHNLKSALK
jgi:hypothetical protein